MKQTQSAPRLKSGAEKLIYTCLFIILLYMLCLYAVADNISPFLIEKLIQSALASTAISLFGGLLLDLEIRRIENQ